MDIRTLGSLGELFARIWRAGLLDWQLLDEVERQRLYAGLVHLLMVFKDVCEAHDQGLIDDPTCEAREGFVASRLCMPGGAMWSAEMQHVFIPSIVLALDDALPKSFGNELPLPHLCWRRTLVP